MTTPKIHKKISNEGEILYVIADQNYSIFHLENGLTLISGYTLKFHEEHLDLAKFVKPNRSILVHKSFVRRIKSKKNASYIQLRNGNDILIARRRLKTIQEQYSLSSAC